ncbi:MAG: chemotaxis protein CheW [Gemmatimonadaceae bacterium]
MMGHFAYSADATDLCDLLVFDVGAERFALPLASVDEVVDGCLIERKSGTGSMAGVLRVRHELLVVFDLAHVLHASRCEAEPVALVLPSARGFIALLVDAAEAAPQVNLSALRTPASFVSADRVLDGVLRVGRRWVGLVNAAALVDALISDTATPLPPGHHGF